MNLLLDLLNEMTEVESSHYIASQEGIKREQIDLTTDKLTTKGGAIFFCDHSRNQGYKFYSELE